MAGIGAAGEAIRKQSAENGIVLESYGGHRNGAMELPSVVGAAERHNTSPASVAMRWLSQQGIAYVSTSSNVEHIADNMGGLAAPSLTPEELDAIRDDPEGERGGESPWESLFSIRRCVNLTRFASY